MDQVAGGFDDAILQRLLEGEYDTIPAWDPITKAHFWIIIAAYRFSGKPNVPTILDNTTVVQANGPGCYYCELVWSPGRTELLCPGNLS